jgi:hypothetical protein
LHSGVLLNDTPLMTSSQVRVSGRFGSVRFWLPDGTTWQEPLDAVANVIGSSARATLRLEHPSIAPVHARLTIDSGRVLIEDLGSPSGTSVDGAQLAPGAPCIVEGVNVRLGEVTLRHSAPGQVAGIVATERPAAQASSRASETAVPTLACEPAGATLDAGESCAFTLTLRNRSRIVDEFAFTLSGFPQAWGSPLPPVTLLPGEEQEFALHVAVPATPEAKAANHRFTVTASSGGGAQQATANGLLVVRPFSSAQLRLHPSSARRNFQVTLANRGNVDRQFTIEGHDEEELLRFSFETPTPVIAAGASATQKLTVHRKKRPLFGPNRFDFFQVMALQTEGPSPGDVIDRGQLHVRPPLQKFKAPFSFMVLVGLIALTAFIAVFLLRDQDKREAKAEAERAEVAATAKADTDATVAAANARAAAADRRAAAAQPGALPGGDEDVHLCDPEDGADTPAPRPEARQVETHFAQNDPRWAKQEYAKDEDPEFPKDWCGSTIEQCGCAMTSVANILTIFKVLTLPDGEALNPSTLNAYFNGDARKTASGWVSRGYVYGDVVWTAVNQLSAAVAKKVPGTRVIEFNRTGSGSDDELMSELKAGRPVVVEVPGHWIAAVGLSGTTIKIWDPYYPDKTTLDAYKGKVRSSVLFKDSDGDQSAVVFTVPAGDRIRITDAQGRVVGNLAETDPRQSVKKAENAIPGASIHYRDAWRDPTCISKNPKPEVGTIQIVIPGPQAGKYKVEVVDATNKDEETSLAIHTYEADGTHGVTHHDEADSMIQSASHDGGDGKAGADLADFVPEPAGTAQPPLSPTAVPGSGAAIRTQAPPVPTPRGGTPPAATVPASATATVRPRRRRICLRTNSRRIVRTWFPPL